MEEPISAYVCDPLAGFNRKARRKLQSTYIDGKVRQFFRARGIDNPHRVKPHQSLASPDYRLENQGGVPFSYFYDVLFNGIQKQEGGEINYVAYTLTFDEELTPQGPCETSELYYGTTFLGEKPFFYYLRLDIQEMLRKLKQHDLSRRYQS